MVETLDRTSALPLWAQLSDRLTAAIRSGQYTDTFPTEYELCDRYGVSRHTVREAIRQLQNNGLVERRRGIGTTVTAQFEQPLGTVYSLFRTIEASGAAQTSTVLGFELRPNARAAKRLQLPDDTNLVWLKRVRLADDEPFAIDEAWLDPIVWPGLSDADFSHTALYIELKNRCGFEITAGHEEIHPTLPTDEEQRLLAMHEPQPLFLVNRLGRTTDRALEWRTSLIRGDRFTYRADWRASSGAITPSWITPHTG